MEHPSALDMFLYRLSWWCTKVLNMCRILILDTESCIPKINWVFIKNKSKPGFRSILLWIQAHKSMGKGRCHLRMNLRAAPSEEMRPTCTCVRNLCHLNNLKWTTGLFSNTDGLGPVSQPSVILWWHYKANSEDYPTPTLIWSRFSDVSVCCPLQSCQRTHSFGFVKTSTSVPWFDWALTYTKPSLFFP